MSQYLITYTGDFTDKINTLLDRIVLNPYYRTRSNLINYNRLIELSADEELLIRVAFHEVKLEKLNTNPVLNPK